MNLAEPILQLFRKKTIPEISVGDVVRVHQRIREGDKERVQVFEGIIIARHGKTSLDATFTVRKIASGVGVEKVYLLHSPNIVKVEFKRGSDVRRAKLYYLRKLSGKSLRMKDKTTNKVAWEEVLGGTDTPTEASEADIAEAVVAEEAKRASEQVATEPDGSDEATESVSGTMESEGEVANEANDNQPPSSEVKDESTNAGGEQSVSESVDVDNPTESANRAGDSKDRA
ncbi:50S ribosomal protein L19 [candidate division Kazan bacterium RIFCSPHIGHO2_01_FULL_44_14]|uniref:Large ribosomal subunit protein bL19 n=1 Tax=candidate division Kazan bacterium RIFCSPLOWO2_01_FULL_45_19 TaxID=1798538 RepID=A0A1F4NQC0_UNCK3|nr:hypothetical protein [uncultured bacterium]AQS31071.1 hypothetical protein [uncultured bacterium]OGB73649.1 MAG: 50S ribosomal protein L19 [candidate division Kazan bacterium RIFCSPLOWO2_01_FULL_45_19]OGB77894.1 MAG: 50S ribosomal protein L19 [candidate division Kazan bacterium RIFCSPHIGHO2_01_FULL_44_14]